MIKRMAGMTACTGERTLNLKNIISEALDALARFDDDELVRIASSRSDRICGARTGEFGHLRD